VARHNVTRQPSSTSLSPWSYDADDVKKRRLEHQGSFHSAVIALSVGVALTVLLIIFAACRCCHGRHGSRKHRKLNVDTEADYLVDGMYL